MEAKVIKFTSLALAVFTLGLTLYTLWIGIRLGFCSWNIVDTREKCSIEYSNDVYYEMNDFRREIADENEFADMVCHMSNGMRLILLVLECAVMVVSYELFWFINECEKRIALRERQQAAKRRKMSRG